MSFEELQSSSPELDKSRLDITIHYGPHSTAQDFDWIEGELRSGSYRILCMEAPGWKPEDYKIFQRLADGDYKTYQKITGGLAKDGAMFAQISAIYASRSRIFFADISAAQERNDYEVRNFGRPEVGAVKSYEDYRAHSLERAIVGGRVISRRDDIIAGNITNGLPTFIEQSPKLSGLDKIKMLISLGDTHRGLAVKLASAGWRVNVEGVQDISSMAANEEALLLAAAGEPIPDRLITECVATTIIHPTLYHPDTNIKRAVLRQLTAGLSEDQVIELVERGQGGGYEWVTKFTEDNLQRLGLTVEGLRLIDPIASLGEMVAKGYYRAPNL